jgi:hypothetical protein
MLLEAQTLRPGAGIVVTPSGDIAVFGEKTPDRVTKRNEE